MKKSLCAAIVAMAALVSCQKPSQPGFAIVIDSESYNQARQQIDRYQEVVAGRGLKPILVIDEWGVPDSIRAKLIELHNAEVNPIEGCVFIGDIPIARVRDAQFLTSAFKMDQDSRFSKTDYCISTDRFYDSFDLKWDFIEQDTARSEYFYYSMRSDSEMKLRPTIYSARIMPRDNARGDKYEKLRRYMDRVNEADANNNPIDNMLYFGGHGNVTDSYEARMDEKLEMYDQLPWLRRQEKGIMFIDFRRDEFIKPRLIDQLQIPHIDYALLHHHGSEEEQLLSGTPFSSSMATQMNSVRNYIHGVARRYFESGKTAKDVKASMERSLESPIPEQWITEATDPAVIAEDEAYSYAQDLHVAEFGNYKPQVRMVSLDACYNGSFQETESIQEAYLFTEGSGTLIAIANSVNSIQDRWINRYLGMAGLGMRVGYFAVMNITLETHVFGDPTFTFTPAADCGFDVNANMTNYSAKFWKKQLESQYPSVQNLAAYMLAERCEGNSSDLLFNCFANSGSGMVRLACLIELAEYNDANFLKAVELGINDGHEMTQRFAVNYAGECGHKELVDPLVSLYCENSVPERVNFDLSSALASYDSASVASAFDRIFAEHAFYTNNDSVRKEKLAYLNKQTTWYVEGVVESITDKDMKERSRISEIRSIRNTPLHAQVPMLLDYMNEPQEPAVQAAIMESLGWFEHSYQRQAIAQKAAQIKDDERFDATVRDQALRAYNRLK